MKHQREHPRPVFGCDDCIAVGNRGTAPDGSLPAGWRYYRVEVTRELRGDYYVMAASREAAQADAEELGLLGPGDLAEADEHAYVVEDSPHAGEPIWTGGPKGEWTTLLEAGA